MYCRLTIPLEYTIIIVYKCQLGLFCNQKQWKEGISMRDGNYQYAVLMTVPLGKRNGELEVTIHQNAVEGFLTMFTVTLPITKGVCDGNQIRFAGSMKTLQSMFPYEATGTISQTQIDLVFHTERGDYPAIGQRRTAAV